MSYLHTAKASIRGHEGLRLKAYKCTSGKTTIGYGRNLDDKGVTFEEAETLLDHDVGNCIVELAKRTYWHRLSDRRKAALIDLCFCVGVHGYCKFVKMEAALEEGDYFEAAEQIIDSRFAEQTGRRAVDLANMLREG